MFPRIRGPNRNPNKTALVYEDTHKKDPPIYGNSPYVMQGLYHQTDPLAKVLVQSVRDELLVSPSFAVGRAATGPPNVRCSARSFLWCEARVQGYQDPYIDIPRGSRYLIIEDFGSKTMIIMAFGTSFLNAEVSGPSGIDIDAGLLTCIGVGACTCLDIALYTHICNMYISTYTYMYFYMNIFMHIYEYVGIYMCVYGHVYIHACLPACMHICIYAYMYIYIYVHIEVCLYIRPHICGVTTSQVPDVMIRRCWTLGSAHLPTSLNLRR